MTVKKRNETLDIMKGFAMLVTIFCHAQQRAFCNNAVVSKSMIWQIVHWWHMPLFFIVSGILASRSEAFGGGEICNRKDTQTSLSMVCFQMA